jgi:monoamine oxidase
VAWRLAGCDGSASNELAPLAAKRPGQRPRIVLFEYSRHLGGRLLSFKFPGAPHLPIELGGMRYLNTHKRVAGLIKHLGLPVKPFPVADPRKTNLFYLRRRRFTAADWKRPTFRPPYRLLKSERGKSPEELLMGVAEKYRSRAPTLYNQGFWNLLLQELSKEAYNLIADACGYYFEVSNWNAAQAIPSLLGDFGPRVQYLALRDGYQKLPLALAEQFQAAGGEVRMRHRLVLVEPPGHRGESDLRLTFDTEYPPEFTRRRISNPTVCHARHVVLAMPRRAIELLHPDSFLFQEQKVRADLAAVLAQPAFKIFSLYSEPWWEKLRVRSGRSDTDLPLRQCYYWGTEGEQEGADPKNRNSILMASYNDGPAVEFWAGLARTHGGHRPEVDWSGPEERRVREAHKVPQKLQAPDVMMHEMQRQLQELHGLADIPMPEETVYKDWTVDPFGGGWHFWKIHARADEIMERIEQPVSGANLYICGEAWSGHQGWVEGALETADSVLRHNFGLAAPAWLRAPGARR